MENRSGLCVDLLFTDAALAEHRAASQLLTRARRRKMHPKTLGREHQIKRQIDRMAGRTTRGLNGRTCGTEA